MFQESFDKITEESVSKLSIAELELLNRELFTLQVEVIKAKRKLIAAEMDKKVKADEAKRKLAAMSDDQKKALLQELQGEKVPSEESVKAAGK